MNGGLDSVTLAYHLRAEGYTLHLLSFDYGQRHAKELAYARRAADQLGAEHDTIDLSGLRRLLKGSALTDDIDVPEGHYAAENMAITVFPNRNAIMLSLAYGAAVAEHAEIVAAGFHGGDHFMYPDCRLAFVDAFEAMQRLAVEGFGHPALRLYTPFLHLAKHDIVRIGAELTVPFEETWSCYRGDELHCGRCGTCVERKLAFRDGGVADPSHYSDPDYGMTFADDPAQAHVKSPAP